MEGKSNIALHFFKVSSEGIEQTDTLGLPLPPDTVISLTVQSGKYALAFLYTFTMAVLTFICLLIKET